MSGRCIAGLAIALYCWAAVAHCGAVLMDVVYASATRGAASPAGAVAADFLLLLVAFALLAAIPAAGALWRSRAATALLAVSALAILAEPLAPLLLEPEALSSGGATSLRIALAVGASILGLLGWLALPERSAATA